MKMSMSFEASGNRGDNLSPQSEGWEEVRTTQVHPLQDTGGNEAAWRRNAGLPQPARELMSKIVIQLSTDMENTLSPFSEGNSGDEREWKIRAGTVSPEYFTLKVVRAESEITQEEALQAVDDAREDVAA